MLLFDNILPSLPPSSFFRMPQSLRLPMSFYLHYLRRRCRRAKEFSFYLCPLYIKRNFQNKITLIQDIRERFSNDYRSVEFLYDLSCLSIRSSKSWPSLRLFSSASSSIFFFFCWMLYWKDYGAHSLIALLGILSSFKKVYTTCVKKFTRGRCYKHCL